MISGIFENCIGTIDSAEALKYWAELGYQVIQDGKLSAQQAGLLYQHGAELTSWRLQNGDSSSMGRDIGLIQPGCKMSASYGRGDRSRYIWKKHNIAKSLLYKGLRMCFLEVNPTPTLLAELLFCERLLS